MLDCKRYSNGRLFELSLVHMCTALPGLVHMHVAIRVLLVAASLLHPIIIEIALRSLGAHAWGYRVSLVAERPTHYHWGSSYGVSVVLTKHNTLSACAAGRQQGAAVLDHPAGWISQCRHK